MRIRTMVIAVLLIAAAGCSKSTKTASGTSTTVTTAPAVATTATTAVATTLPGAVTTAPAASATTAPAGSATTAPATSGLTGAWPGEWQNTTPDSSRGTFRIQWTQSGSSLSGTIAITGTPCLTGGSISGSLNGGNLNFGVVTGQAQVSYTGTVSGTTMSGTYTTSCGNAQGTWKATKA